MSSITVRPLGEDDWKLYRDIRLNSLSESPDAFAATVSSEQEVDEPIWRARMNRSQRLLAETEGDDQPVGVVSLRIDKREDEDTPYGELFGLWVKPQLRGSGIADKLLDALLERARSQELGAVIYWVGTDNAPAVAFASSRGFLPTEYRRPMKENSRDVESTEEAAFLYPLGTAPSEVPSSVLNARP